MIYDDNEINIIRKGGGERNNMFNTYQDNRFKELNHTQSTPDLSCSEVFGEKKGYDHIPESRNRPDLIMYNISNPSSDRSLDDSIQVVSNRENSKSL